MQSNSNEAVLNSLFILPFKFVKDSLVVEVDCTGQFEDKILNLYNSMVKFSSKGRETNPMIYLPKILLPSYEGKKIKITWSIRVYDKKKVVMNETLKLKSVFPITPRSYYEKFGEYEVKISNLNFIGDKENDVMVFFNRMPQIEKIELACEESINSKFFASSYSQLVYNKEVGFELEKNVLHFKFTVDKNLPSVNNAVFRVNHFFQIKARELLIKIPFYVYQEKPIFLPESKEGLKNLVIKYLNEYGPMKVGELISIIAKKEKIRVKSKILIAECEELIKKGIIAYIGLGLHAGVLYLRDKWAMQTSIS